MALMALSQANSSIRHPIVSVCTPVHNEEHNLRELARRIAVAMDAAAVGSWECIMVDDGSTDSSRRILHEIGAADGRFRALYHDVNQGETAAWHTAFRAVRGDIACMIAADLQSPPEELPRLVAAVVNDGYDVGTGRRAKRKDGAYYSFSTWVLTKFSRIIWGVNVRDVSSSFFAVRSKFVEDIKLLENDHRCILAIVKRRGARIKEIDTAHFPRLRGASHYSRMKVLRAIPEVTRFTIRLYRGYYDQ
jgi:dolichol-phosphate mannosyltransferase